jgi:transposase-like protein
MTTIAQVESQVKRIWHSSFQSELNEALEHRLREQALVGVRAALQGALAEELDAHLGFNRYERRSREADKSGSKQKPAEEQRSGTFKRAVETSYGYIPDLRVPKLRRGNKEREWGVLTRYQSTQQIVLDKALYLYVLGLSLRDLQEGLYLFLNHVLSRTAINRVTLAAQGQMEVWRRASLTETPPILIVDGVWVKILYPTGETWTDRSEHERQRVRGKERTILAVMGVWPDGRHQIIHYEAAPDETADTWSAVCQHLIERGLDSKAVRMVVSDGTKGLLEAMRIYLPQAKWQRCTVHKVRGFERYLKYENLPETDPTTGQALTPEQARQQHRHAIKSEALAVFEAPTRTQAEQRLADFVARWKSIEPGAVHNFVWGIERCYTFYQLDSTLHTLVRSTNAIERFFREFRNKADEIGAFPNEDSCLTLFHLVMVREHAKHNRVDFAKTG